MDRNSFGEKIKKVHWGIWLGLIIVIAVIRLIVIFNGRDGHHVDETWSYGFANSYYDPYVYTDNKVGITYGPEGIKNLGLWISGEVFDDYITVSPDQRFSVDSVIYNKEEDLGPLLYELILHFVCSLFPDTFSWWYAFALNLCLFIPTIIFVCLISYEITNSKICGFICSLYYIFSGCGTGAFLYLRVYSLFTFLSVALFYLIVRLLKYKTEKFNKLFFILPVVCLLGCFTHYYYLVVAFLFTFFGAVMLLIKKRWMDSLRLCYVMLYSVMAFFAMYFQCVHMLIPHSTGEATVAGYSFPYTWELATANMHFFMGTVGFYINFTTIYLLIALGVIFFATAFIGLICFLFRNEKWMKTLVGKVKSFIKKLHGSSTKLFASMDSSAYIALPVSIAYILILPKSASLVTMGFVERYFFPGMTIFQIFYISVVAKGVLSARFAGAKNIVIISILVLLIGYLDFRSNVFTDSFKFYGAGDKELAEELKGRDVYIVVDNTARDMTWISSILKDSNNVYIELTGELDSGSHDIPDLPDDCLVLLNSRGFLQEDEFGEPILEYDITTYVSKPHLIKTTRQFIDDLGAKNGCSYSLIGEYDSFIGILNLYERNEK